MITGIPAGALMKPELSREMYSEIVPDSEAKVGESRAQLERWKQAETQKSTD